MSSPNYNKQPYIQAYAVIRIDWNLLGDKTVWTFERDGKTIPTAGPCGITVKEIVLTAELAQNEVLRLNKLNGDNDCTYYWQTTHLFNQGGSHGAAQADLGSANPTRKIQWQRIEIESPELLMKCVGLKGHAWAYMTGHSQLLVRFYESGSWNGIYLFCKGCEDVHFQSSWPNANVTVEILAGQYGREYMITDGDRLRIHCSAAFLTEYEGYLQFSDMYADELE